jgi:hypothetical protein
MPTVRSDAAFLVCLCDRETIVLPRRSPLGIYVGPQYQPMGAWPIELVCTRRGQLFVRSRKEIQSEGILHRGDQNKHSPVLWQIERKCGRERCPKNHAIFLWYAADATREEIASEILRAAPKISCGETEIELSVAELKMEKLLDDPGKDR